MLRHLKSLSTLQWTLALSVLLHAVLLTVRFVDPEVLRRALQQTSLDVILVNIKSDQNPDPDKAQAIAQSSLAGGGDAADKHIIVSTPLPPTLADSPGDSVINESQRRLIRQQQEDQERLIVQVRQQIAAMPKFDADRLAKDPEARAQEEHRQQQIKLLAAIERRVEEENARPRKRYLSPATLGAVYAPYYDRMRVKVNTRGTEDFPQVAGRKLYGEVLMSLLINHDGRILDVHVVHSSGNRVLDRLAQAIAQSAAPFGPFTTEMRKDSDQFDVTALFKFTRDQTLETSLQPGSAIDTEP
ncbi:MAG: TonB family protein [Burkholderiaceae bacterium]|jgi:protein TonB|nr:TonB family protein [Burkholderiaceae bacterium]